MTGTSQCLISWCSVPDLLLNDGRDEVLAIHPACPEFIANRAEARVLAALYAARPAAEVTPGDLLRLVDAGGDGDRFVLAVLVLGDQHRELQLGSALISIANPGVAFVLFCFLVRAIVFISLHGDASLRPTGRSIGICG